jgi:hypothetical protein
MKNVLNVTTALTVLTALFASGCASTKLEQTWKAPTAPASPVKKVAVIGVDERGLMRIGFENRFVRDMKARGQTATATHELMTLPDIKADKEAAAVKLRAAGADAVLIVRLADSETFNRSVRAGSERYVGTTTGVGSYYGWYDYYTVAFTDMSTVWSSDKKTLYLDSSLYDLASEKRIWSALTETVIKDGTTDPLVEADRLTKMVVEAMAKDQLIR